MISYSLVVIIDRKVCGDDRLWSVLSSAPFYIYTTSLLADVRNGGSNSVNLTFLILLWYDFDCSLESYEQGYLSLGDTTGVQK